MWRLRDESVSMERLDGETILINFDTGQYFSFTGPAADVLWLVEAGVDPSHWPAILVSAFADLSWDDASDQQVADFLAGLENAGVIEESAGDGTSPVTLPDDYERGPWTPPAVQANDELADLLVIDPIHDASEDGWPQIRSS
jgi:hypothetical protein